MRNSTLTFREWQVLKERVEGGLSLEKMGKLWHISPERVRQILYKCLRKIEFLSRSDKLREEDLSEFLSIRTVNALREIGIKTVSQCRVEFERKGELHFLGLKNIGKVSLKEIINMCHKESK